VDLGPHWRGRERYVVFDAAWGDGSAFEALATAWRADPQRPAHLHYIALAEGMLPGFHRLPQADAAITLDLLCAPLAAALAQLSARLDAVRLNDARGEFARPLARLCVPGTILSAAGLAPDRQAALAAAGFVWDAARSGAVFASRKPFAAPRTAPERRAVVIGAGLAGAAACERLCARGWQVTLVERHAQPAMEASGNLAGIFMPLLSRDDNIPTRLARAAYLFALRYWAGIGGIGAAIEGAQCGVLQLARDAGHAQVQRAIAAERGYPREFAEWLDSDAVGALLDHPTAGGTLAAWKGAPLAPDGAWLFRQGGWARPGSVCAAMLAACGERLIQRFGVGSVTLERGDGEWLVRDAQGATVAQAPTVILANGAGAAQLAQSASLPLDAVRGQVTHLDAAQVPALPFVLCREAYLTPPAHGICSAGASYDEHADPVLSAASQRQNLDKLRSMLGDPGIGAAAPLAGRVGFRSVAPDRLPLVGALADDTRSAKPERLRNMARHPGLHTLLAYASRGLIWAPLAAELLASQLEAEPLPLETTLVRALDPARFLLRGRRNNTRLGNNQ